MKKRRYLTSGYDTVIFDCDSTLTGIEGVNLLAQKKGVEKEVKALTDKAINAKINLEDAFSARLNLIKPQKKI